MKEKNIEIINEIILEEVRDNLDSILSSEWFDWKDCWFGYLREEDYEDNMIVFWYGDRGGIYIDFMYESKMEEEDDKEFYRDVKEENFDDYGVMVVVENGKIREQYLKWGGEVFLFYS